MMSEADAMAVICALSPKERAVMLWPARTVGDEVGLKAPSGTHSEWVRNHHRIERLIDAGLLEYPATLTPDGIAVRTALHRMKRNER